MNNLHRTNDKQKSYQDWELTIIKTVNGKGVTADELIHVIKRSRGSITRKASEIGSSLKGDVK